VKNWERLPAVWRTCFEEGWTGNRAGSGFVGAAVTDREGKVLSVGAGHVLTGSRVGVRGEEGEPRGIHPLAHAELLALLSLDTERRDPEGCVLWTTVEPCPMCLGAVVMANVRELRYACRDPWAGGVDILGKTPYMERQRARLRVRHPEDPELEGVIAVLATEHSLRTKGRPNFVARALAGVYPPAAKVGERLFTSGLVQKMRERDAPAEEVYHAVAGLLAETG
jgi:tRNA(adenine34) deaminase